MPNNHIPIISNSESQKSKLAVPPYIPIISPSTISIINTEITLVIGEKEVTSPEMPRI